MACKRQQRKHSNGSPREPPERTNVVLILPLEPDLSVMVLVDQFQEPAQQMLALRFRYAVDVFDMGTNWVYGLPASDRVRTNDWVDCLEL